MSNDYKAKLLNDQNHTQVFLQDQLANKWPVNVYNNSLHANNKSMLTSTEKKNP